MHILSADSHDLRFPPVSEASVEGLLAVGGDLRPERLIEAYRHGIFPWYSRGQPILWWSPDPRAVLFPARLKLSRSLRKRLRHGDYRVSFDQAFGEVMRSCAGPRGQSPSGTWITPEMLAAYSRLHALGYAHSVEAWDGENLAGGLYGVALGAAFFGESMFSRATDASKVAFAHLVRQLEVWGYALIDCQVASAHLSSLGTEEIPRADFMAQLAAALEQPGRPAPWQFDVDLKVV
jgi:leucyl/phenylalanyl-tRNA--protein transferase